MSKLYVGIDPGLNDTGIVAISDNGEHLVFNVGVPDKKGVSLVKRLTEYGYQLRMTFEQIGIDKITHIGLEEPKASFAGRGVYVAYAFAIIVDMIINLFSLEPVIYTPGAIKKFATGKGNCGKDLMILAVYKKWGVTLENHNAADAYAIAQLVRAEEEK